MKEVKEDVVDTSELIETYQIHIGALITLNKIPEDVLTIFTEPVNKG